MQVGKQVSILMKGPFGFGKTDALASFAAGGEVFLAYFDKKDPIELKYYFTDIIKRPELLKNIDYEIYGAHNAHEYLNKLNKLINNNPYFAIGTDSVTNLTSAAVNWSLGFRNVKDGAKMDDLNSSARRMIPDFDEYKVETGLVTQALDVSRSLKSHIIWTAHPIPSLKIEAGGAAGSTGIRVSKVNNIVTYGSKVGALVPGNFQEIYHFMKESEWNGKLGRSELKFKVTTESLGDDFAKTAINLPKEFDITNKLFYEVWSELVKEATK